MAYSDNEKREALALLREGVSVNGTARRLGVSPATVSSWRTEQEARNAGTPTDAALTEPGEAAVAKLLLSKSEALLAGIEELPSKSRMETATAVDKLVSKYLALTGKVAESHVTVTHESEEKLEDLLAGLARNDA